MAKHNELGKAGEIRAREFLLARGYKFVPQTIKRVNWRLIS